MEINYIHHHTGQEIDSILITIIDDEENEVYEGELLIQCLNPSQDDYIHDIINEIDEFIETLGLDPLDFYDEYKGYCVF